MAGDIADTFDKDLTADDYAHAPGDDPGEWQLPINSPNNIEGSVNAIATGGHSIPPGSALSQAKANIARAIVGLSPAEDHGALLNKLYTGDHVDPDETDEVDDSAEPVNAPSPTSPTTAPGASAGLNGSTGTNTRPRYAGPNVGPSGMNMGIKSLGGNRVGGYGVVWGSATNRDLTGEYFHPKTDLGLDSPLKARPMLYHHGLDGTVGDTPIGIIDTFKADTVGLWVEGQLDQHNKYVDGIKRLIERGALGWSSGTMPHQARKSADGRIDHWPIFEVSVTPTPAQPYSTEVSLKTLTTAYKALNLSMGQVLSFSALLASEGDDMSLDNVKAAVREVLAENGQTTKSLNNGRLPAPPAAPARSRLEVLRGTKYSDLSASDMSFMHEILSTAPRTTPGYKTWQPGIEFYRELADKMERDVRQNKLPASTLKALEASGFLKSLELDTVSGQTGYGAEWAPDSWRGELWLRVRQDNVVAPQLNMIEMPTNPYELPYESTDPTVYFVPETTDQAQLVLTSGNPIPQSKVGSGKVQLSAKKLALRQAWSSELNEDVLMPIVANYRRQSIRAMQNAIDNVLLNGDTVTSANTNVNLIDSTPSSTAKYLAFNGLRKYCLVTNSTAISAAGVVTLPLIRKARFLMSGAYALRPQDIAVFVDDSTYAKLLGLPEFISADKFPQPTNVSGLLGRLDGMDVFPTAELGLSQLADGKTSNTGSNNTKGQMLFVFKPLWMVGYRREVTAFIEHIAWADVFHLTVTARLTMAAQDAQSASELYGITV